MKIQAESGKMDLQAKECWQPKKLGERNEADSLSNPPEGTRPADARFCPSDLQDCEREENVVVLPPSLWQLVVAMLRN